MQSVINRLMHLETEIAHHLYLYDEHYKYLEQGDAHEAEMAYKRAFLQMQKKFEKPLENLFNYLHEAFLNSELSVINISEILKSIIRNMLDPKLSTSSLEYIESTHDYILNVEMPMYIAALKDLVKESKIDFPDSRLTYWKRFEGRPAKYIWDNIAKGLHDLAIIISLFMGDEDELIEKIKDIKMDFEGATVTYAFPYINIQADTGHSIKIDVVKGKIFGQIGNFYLYSHLEGDIIGYDSLSQEEKVQVLEKIADILGSMINTEQTYRMISFKHLNESINILLGRGTNPELITIFFETPQDFMRNLKFFMPFKEQVEKQIGALQKYVNITRIEYFDELKEFFENIDLLKMTYSTPKLLEKLNDLYRQREREG